MWTPEKVHLSAGSRVAVVGGGIGGILMARELQKKGCRVTVFEAEPTLGGKCGTLNVDGFEYNLGGHL
eukprot:680479-Rhodomonas_salina.1